MRLLPPTAFRDIFEPLQGKRVGYVRLPGNVGDALIELATFQLLQDYGIEFFRQDPQAPCTVDELLIAGGGNMGNLYPECRRVREQTLRLHKPVTVLPQSFASAEPLPYHRVFVRERDSLRFRPDALLAPDLALGLDLVVHVGPDRGTGVWLRRDQEGRFSHCKCDGDPIRVGRSRQKYLQLAAHYEHIITDRLHFAIAGLLCGRRVTLLPNRYHKNRGVYEAWLHDLGCAWADTPEEALRAEMTSGWQREGARLAASPVRRGTATEQAEVTLEKPSLSEDQGWFQSTVRLNVNERLASIWYRVLGQPIADGLEPFLAAGLFPAMRLGLPLRSASPLSARLLQQLPRIQSIHRCWDGCLRPVAVRAETAARGGQPAAGVGCFFSGGVDSFYTVLQHQEEISALIFVHGFDLPLTHQKMRKKVAQELRAAAAALGKPLIEVETNVRDLSDRYIDWYYSYGAALASVGLLLAPRLGKIYIPASHSFADLIPCGSHPLHDPLWSTEAVELMHDGCEAKRFEKVARVAQHEIAVRFLRVCWEYRGGKYNCSRCEKCLRTMIGLQLADALSRCPTFDRKLDLDAIARLPLRDANARSFFEENLKAVQQDGRFPELERALSTCLHRATVAHLKQLAQRFRAR